MPIRLLRLLLCCLGMSLPAALHADDLPQPRFPPPPRLATTAEELASWKQSGEFETRRQAAIVKGDRLLQQPVTIPDGWGNWIFYYACDDDGTGLTPMSLAEHRCPRCGKVQSDERTVAAYRTVLYNKADQAALDLGWAYALTGEPRYAAEVRRILLAYAAAYPKYPSRRDRWGREGLLATIGGRRYCQSLDEAVGVLLLAKAYDLTRTSALWSDDDRALVERDLFRTVATVLQYWNYGTINHQTWYNAGLLSIANVTADRDLAEKVITMPGGYRDQLARAIGPDGMWREGTMAYHSYALQAMEQLVDAGRGLGLDLHKEPGLQKMYEFPLAYAYPNGQFPAINDSDPINLAGFEHHFRWARQKYGDTIPWPSRDQRPVPGQIGSDAPAYDLPGAGVVVLRNGQGESASCAMLDYGEHGGGHGHPDKQQLLLIADGREWLLDPGRLDYSHREHKTWYRQTVAHNTVVVNSRSQLPCTGMLRFVNSDGDGRSCLAECTQAYPDTTIRRWLVLLEDCLIDLCTVETRTAKTIDCLIHANADSVTLAGAESAPLNAPLGTTDGYEHLSDLLRWTPAAGAPTANGTHLATFTARQKQLRVWLLAAPDESLISAKCFGYNLEPRIPCLVRRVANKSAVFAAVYDWSAGDGRITAVTRSDDGRITVQRADGSTRTHTVAIE
jgi:hypothetical protein